MITLSVEWLLVLLWLTGTVSHWAAVSLSDRHAIGGTGSHPLTLLVVSLIWPLMLVLEILEVIRDQSH